MVINESIIKLIHPFLLIMLALLVFQGYKKGFISKLLECFSFFLIVLLSWNLAPIFSKVFKILPKSIAPYQDTPLKEFFYGYSNQIFIFILIVIVASLILFLLKPIAQIFTHVPGISFVNATFGAFFGVVEMVMLCFVLLFVLHSPFIQNGQEIIESTVFQNIEELQEKVFVIGNDILEEYDLMSEGIVDQKNIQKLKELLEQQGYSDEVVQEFIGQLGN